MMKRTVTLATLTLASAMALGACGGADEAGTTGAITDTATAPADSGHDAHNHPADGGQPPAGITVEDNPTYQVGTEVILTADHMPGMQEATATISGAFDTTT